MKHKSDFLHGDKKETWRGQSTSLHDVLLKRLTFLDGQLTFVLVSHALAAKTQVNGCLTSLASAGNNAASTKHVRMKLS